VNLLTRVIGHKLAVFCSNWGRTFDCNMHLIEEIKGFTL